MSEFLDNVIQTADDVWEILNTLKNQYAFPLAFIRELIQNSLDAGTRKVEVVLEERSNTEKQSYLIYRVRDYGCGMDLNDIRQNYFCLFNSTKEGDRTTAGQFGVGVSSCWAIDPEYFFLTTGKDGSAYKFGWQRGMKQFKGKELTDAWLGTEVEVWRLLKSKRAKKHDGTIEDEVLKAKELVFNYFKYNPVPVLFKAVYAGDCPVETVDFEKLNLPFDLSEPVRLHINTGHPEAITLDADVEIKAVMTLSEKPWTRYEVKHIMIEENNNCPLGDNLKLIVNSTDFKYPIARNTIQNDDNFKLIFGALDKATAKLYDRFFQGMTASLISADNDEDAKTFLSWGFEILQSFIFQDEPRKMRYSTAPFEEFEPFKKGLSLRGKQDFLKKLAQFNKSTKGFGIEADLFPLITGEILSLNDIAKNNDIDFCYYLGTKNDKMKDILHKEGISLLHLPDLHLLKKIYKFLDSFIHLGWVEDWFRVVEPIEANLYNPSVIESFNTIKEGLKEISALARMGIEDCILGRLFIYDRTDNETFLAFLHKSDNLATLTPPNTNFIERFFNLSIYKVVINVKHNRFEHNIKKLAKTVQKSLEIVREKPTLTRTSYKDLPNWKLFLKNQEDDG